MHGALSMVSEDALKRLLIEVLDERRSVTDEQHSVHHHYIESELRRREARQQMIQKFKASFVGGVALAAVAALGWLGQLVLDAVKRSS